MTTVRVLHPRRTPTYALLVALAGGSFGCAHDERREPAPGTAGTAGSTTDPGGTPVEGDGETDFISDGVDPQQGSRNGGQSESAGSGGAVGAVPGSNAAVDGSATSDSPERAISEADIIKVEGDTLYALSRYSGLTVIDLSNPAELRILGNYRSTAMPFEMYLEAGTAYIMYNGYAQREWDELNSTYVWRSSSRMLALDVTNPAVPRVLGYQDVPGEISDSRKVGDIVYVVTHESGYCWQCDSLPNTRVTSYDVSDPSRFVPVDHERFEDPNQSYGVRHVSVSEDRMYVSGYAWSNTGTPLAGNIQVIDISDPRGELVPGAVVEVTGQIDNRWQMDEYDGVLRVISQPSTWNALPAPVLQTFAIESSSTVTPLASLAMALPRAEQLQSVRFDGTRAFAVTFERTDPLFTFDVSDPARPLQVGELEIPGFLYFMEPRGDRLYSLGFDNASEVGALHVSIFDVANLAQPTLLDRVNFGGDWAWLAEDQDRVHKIFNLALDQELILLPYSGSLYDEATCYYEYGSGIQLIDARGDDLALRGVAPQVGEARRALLHDDFLFGVSDNAIQAFDISDRDAPLRVDRLDVARNVSVVKPLGEDLLRFGQNWWTGEVELDLVPIAQAEAAQSDATLDLSALSAIRDRECVNNGTDYSSTYTYFDGQVFVRGDYAFLPRSISEYGTTGGTYYNRDTKTISIVALTGADAPRIVGEIALEPAHYDYNDSRRSTYYAGFVQTEDALLVGRRTGYTYSDPTTGESSRATFEYDVIDIAAGARASVVSRFEVPDHVAGYGWGYMPYGCMLDMAWGWYGYYYGTGSGTLSSGDIIASQHQEPLDDGSARSRYYLDRFDVSNPAEPLELPAVNIPGQLIHYDHATGQVVTLEDVREILGTSGNYRSCYDAHPEATWEIDQAAYQANGYDYERTPGTCVRWHRRINSLLLEGDLARRVSQLDLPTSSADRVVHSTGSIAVSNERIFYQAVARNMDTGAASTEIVALGYRSNGEITLLGSAASNSSYAYYYGGFVARGKRAFLTGEGSLEVFESPDGEAPVRSEHELRSWSCSIEVVGDELYCAGNEFGVQRIALD
jgi:hypothetical protein